MGTPTNYASNQDLASVVALNLLAEAFHPQLSIKTLATAVVDFSGRRLIAQSLVPGILNVSVLKTAQDDLVGRRRYCF